MFILSSCTCLALLFALHYYFLFHLLFSSIPNSVLSLSCSDISLPPKKKSNEKTTDEYCEVYEGSIGCFFLCWFFLSFIRRFYFLSVFVCYHAHRAICFWSPDDRIDTLIFRDLFVDVIFSFSRVIAAKKVCFRSSTKATPSEKAHPLNQPEFFSFLLIIWRTFFINFTGVSFWRIHSLQNVGRETFCHFGIDMCSVWVRIAHEIFTFAFSFSKCKRM